VWSNWQNWTSDPSGSTLVNALNLPPQPGDAIVILNGTTITNDVSNQVASTTTINSGATLDMSTTTGNTLGTVSGAGLLRIGGFTGFAMALPTGAYTSFVTAGTGGTIEYYNATTGTYTLPTTQTTYNNLKLSTSISTVTFTETNNLTINGNLNITSSSTGIVTWQINDATNASLTITIAGDVTVSANGKITAGTGNSGSTTQHSLVLSGNLTNSGIIQFFDPTDATYSNANFTSGTVYTTGLRGNAVNVTFSGTTNKTLTCNNQTDFYRLIVNKGTGQQALLIVTATAPSVIISNMRLFGPANLGSSSSNGADGSTATSNNALSIVNGTLELTGTLTIPILTTTGTCITPPPGVPTITCNIYFAIPQSGGLWLNGAGVNVTVASSSAANDDQRLLVQGLLRVTAGTLSCGFSKGVNSGAAGVALIEGGTLNTWQIRPTTSSPQNFSYTQTGGTVNVGVTGIQGTGVVSPGNQYARFSISSSTSSFIMSGGTLNIGNPSQNSTLPTAQGIDIRSASSNYNVTGGTINAYIPNSAGYNFGINTSAPLYDLNINSEGTSGGFTAVLNHNLTVLHNLILVTGNSPTLNCSGKGLTVGGDFNIQASTIFTPTSNTITFNGSGAQTFTYNGVITASSLDSLVVNKSGGTLTLAGTGTFTSASNTNIPTLILTSGTLADAGKTIDVTSALTNNATHSGAGQINVNTAGAITIGGNNGTFGNLSITTNNTISTNGTQTVTGTLRLIGANSTLSISSNALTVLGSIYSDAASGVAFGVTKRILTSGLHNAGGLTRQGINGPGAAGDILFPVGSAAVGTNPAVPYTPNTINVTATGQGTITVRPVNSEHPNVTTTGQSLRYYWRVTSTGYSGITAVSHKTYNFSTAVQVTGLTGALSQTSSNLTGMTGPFPKTYTNVSVSSETGSGSGALFTVVVGSATAITSVTATTPGSGYVTGDVLTFLGSLFGGSGATSATYTLATPSNYVASRYDRSLNNWSKNNTPQTMTGNIIQPSPFNTGTGWTLGTGVVGDQLDGEYTCGNGAFGAVTTYYSRTSGNWNDATAVTGVWSNISNAGAACGCNPIGCPTCPVIIGDGTRADVITTVANSFCGSLALNTNATLNCSTFTGHNFGTSTGGSVTGTGTLRIASANFPAGDFTNFLGSNGGTVEWYGTSYTIPSIGPSPQFLSLANYYNLVLNPNSGATITLPASNLTVYNNWTQNPNVSPADITRIVVTNGTRSLTINGNLNIAAGLFRISNAASVTTMIVVGNTTIGTGAIFGAAGGGTANVNTFTTSGGITNNGTLTFSNNSVVNLTFTGSNSVNFDGTGSVAAAPNGTTLNLVTVNKGNSQTPSVTFSVGGTVNAANTGVSGGWLSLINGSFIFNNSSTYTISSFSGPYTIPSTANLTVNTGTVTISSANSGAADLLLNGSLTVSGTGTANVGASTSAGVFTNTVDNDLEYSAAGTPTINVSGSGVLNVSGSIRRSTAILTGALVYNQSGGSVYVGGFSPTTSVRGIFEIDYNTGSSFTMSSGGLTIQRPNTVTPLGSYEDLFLNPITSSVGSSSTISIGLATGTNPFSLNSAPSLGNLTFIGSSGAYTSTLYSNPLVLSGNLTINTNATLATNSLNVSIGGNLAGSGTYNGLLNTTTFSGTSASGQSAFLTSTSQFLNMTVNNTGGATVQLATGSTAPNTLNNLNILGGIFDVNGLALNVSGNVTNNSSQINSVGGTTGAIILSGSSAAHTITSSNGNFNNLYLGGTAATVVYTVNGNMTINGILNFNPTGSTVTSGYLFIGANLLTFSGAASISNAGTTKFIKTNGVSSDLGVTKNWPVGTNSFTYAVGTRTNYTPVIITGLVVTTAGNYNVVPVDAVHPTASPDGTNILDYYWKFLKDNTVLNSGTGTIAFQVPTGLIGGSGGTLEGAYLDVTNLIGWTGGGSIGVAGGNTTLTFTNSLGTVMPPGPTANPSTEFDYTFGTTSDLLNPIASLYSFLDNPNVLTSSGVGGSWASSTSWTTSSTGHGTAVTCCVTPSGRPMVILPTARINLDAATPQSAFSTVISGLLVVSTTGHNIGSIINMTTPIVSNSTGTMRTTTSTLPAGIYTIFTSAGGGTVEYAAPIVMNSRSTYNNLLISSTVSTTAANLTVNGNLTIGSGNSLNNSSSGSSISIGIAGNCSNNGGTFNAGTGTTGINMTIAGNWTNTGTFNSGTGTSITLSGNWTNTGGTYAGSGTVTLAGSSPQTVTGSTTFNNLTLAASANTTLSGAATTTVGGVLTMTNGDIISSSTNTLSLLSTASVSGGSGTSYVSGPMKAVVNSGSSQTFPLGNLAANYFRPATIANTTATDTWSAQYYAQDPSAGGYPYVLSASIQKVSAYEYWTISPALGTTQADLTLLYNTGSYNGANIGTPSTLLLAGWTGSEWDIPTGGGTVSQSGTNITGTVTQTGISSYSATIASSVFTFGSTDPNSALPIELTNFTGTAEKYGVNLLWKTASELNNNFFTVLRSSSGTNFEPIGTVKGNGTTSSSHAYTLTDFKPEIGKNYYQLQQTDFDGNKTSSEIIVVNVLHLDQQASLYPNPVSQKQLLNVEINALQPDVPVELQIVNMQGINLNSRIVQTDSDGTLRVTISTANLSAGLYILRAQGAHFKFIVE